jgi:hypothetical protein
VRCLSIAVLLMTVSTIASAQTERGMEEFSVGGSYVGGDTEESGQLNAMYGYFFQRDWQVSISGWVLHVKNEDVTGTISGQLSLYLPSESSKSAPYIGLEVGTGFGEIRPNYILGGFVGIKEYLFGSERVGGAFWLQASYRQFNMKSGDDRALYGAVAGLSLFFD